jgi:hypothetical protein
MKAKLLADDSIELDGSPEEITAVICETYARARTIARPEISGHVPETLDILNMPAESGPERIRKSRRPKNAKVHRKTRGKRETWTDDQIDLLKDNHATKDMRELSKLTGHPQGAVRTKLIQLRNKGELK